MKIIETKRIIDNSQLNGGDKTLVEEKEPTPGEGVLTDKNKKDWNDFLSYLKTKGVQGRPELDKGNLGNIYFEEYIKNTPGTSLSKELIPKIRQEYIAERNARIAEMKAGKLKLQGKENIKFENLDLSSFMPHIVKNEKSTNPNYVGQYLTMTPFQGAKLKDEYGKIIATKQFNTTKDSGESLNKLSQALNKNK